MLKKKRNTRSLIKTATSYRHIFLLFCNKNILVLNRNIKNITYKLDKATYLCNFIKIGTVARTNIVTREFYIDYVPTIWLDQLYTTIFLWICRFWLKFLLYKPYSDNNEKKRTIHLGADIRKLRPYIVRVYVSSVHLYLCRYGHVCYIKNNYFVIPSRFVYVLFFYFKWFLVPKEHELFRKNVVGLFIVHLYILRNIKINIIYEWSSDFEVKR